MEELCKLRRLTMEAENAYCTTGKLSDKLDYSRIKRNYDLHIKQAKINFISERLENAPNQANET